MHRTRPSAGVTHGPGDTRLSAALNVYEALAVREAVESGMARSELAAILDGQRVTELVPPYAGEPAADYAARATGELMVRYLAISDDDIVPPQTGRP